MITAMCYALYAASDAALPIVPWNAETPAFHVEELSDGDEVVARQFSLPHVRYLGAHTGCGCGFINDDGASDAAAEASCAALARYLAAASRQGTVEVFLCWEGGQDTPAKLRGQVASADFIGHPFPLAEDQLATLLP